MLTEHIHSIEQDTETIATVANQFLRATGYLYQALEKTSELEEIYTRRTQLHGGRTTRNVLVVLNELGRLQDAVNAGVISASVHLRALARLGVFDTFRGSYRDELHRSVQLEGEHA